MVTPAVRPPLPLAARVAIVGAGCAGLTCAEELRERGYTSITLFDAAKRAGGKIRSVGYEGAPAGGRGLFEAGTVFFIPSPMWKKLLRRHGVSEACAKMPRVRVADLASGRVTSPIGFANGYSTIARLDQALRLYSLLARHSRAHDAEPGIAAHVADDVCTPAGEWFEQQRLGFIRDVALPIVAAAQFGPLIADVPALYVLQLLTMLQRFGLGARIGLRIPQLCAGHEEVWSRIAASHDTRLGDAVTAIRRDDAGVTLTTARGSERFDALIVALPPDRYLAAADATAQERDLFGRVRSLDRVILTARVRGLPKSVFYAVRYAESGAVPAGHPYLMYEVDPESGLFTFHPFLDAGVTVAAAERAVRDVVTRLGGELEAFEHRRIVRGYFPHFGAADLRDGVYQKLESMQGQRATWYAGELFAGIGVPHAMEYAARLVERMTAPST